VGDGLVVFWSETKADTNLLQTPRLLLSRQGNVNPELFKNLSRAPAGTRSVSVLRNPHAAGGGNNAGGS
jgi:hypothetical protein